MKLRHLGAAALALAVLAAASSAADARRYSPVRYCWQAASFGWSGRVAKCQPRQARSAHRHRRPGGAGLVTVRTAAGIQIRVAPRAAANFSGFVADLVASGYHISFMGGWRAHGSCAGCDMHPRGLAIDINQTGRNRVTRAFPVDVTAMAARHGLTHGAVWSNPDQGHFELAGVHRYAARGHRPRYAHGYHRRRYAAG